MILLWKPESTKNDEDSSSVFDIALRRDISLLIPRISLCLKMNKKSLISSQNVIVNQKSFIFLQPEIQTIFSGFVCNQ